ncbi:uncharacterized protein TNCV_2527631 [Trichonephila clavipes]|nr:uncharacterized protein TNCV_2527631 [Trichonephila clavipes]
MFTSQISKILSKEAPRDFLGVYPSDKIPKVKKKAALVVNTDPHDEEGSHWLAMYIQDEKTIEFFDSYGFPPSVYEPHISQYVKLFPNVIYNETSLQNLTSNVCGQYCIFYLLKRCKGHSQ